MSGVHGRLISTVHECVRGSMNCKRTACAASSQPAHRRQGDRDKSRASVLWVFPFGSQPPVMAEACPATSDIQRGALIQEPACLGAPALCSVQCYQRTRWNSGWVFRMHIPVTESSVGERPALTECGRRSMYEFFAHQSARYLKTLNRALHEVGTDTSGSSHMLRCRVID